MKIYEISELMSKLEEMGYGNVDISDILHKLEMDTVSVITGTDVLENYIGTTEYNGIVAKIQKWYYGRLVKAPWCATCASWVLDQLKKNGVSMLDTLKCKDENVYNMYKKLLQSKTEVNGDIKRGDIIILCFDNKFNTTASKHVTFAYKDTPSTSKTVSCLGGNQCDKICVKDYNRSNIVGIFRPDYSGYTL